MLSKRQSAFLSAAVLIFGLLTAANSAAQQPGMEGPVTVGPMGGREHPARLQLGPPGRWWDDPDMAQRLGITSDQQKKMDDIFNSNRLKLIDLFAAVQKQEAIMEPLVEADPPDENKVLAQIDRVAQARSELEKANARMLLELRRQLSHEQWVKLQAERPPMHHGRMPKPPGEPGKPAEPMYAPAKPPEAPHDHP